MKPPFGARPGAPPARCWPRHAGGSRSGRMTASPRGTRGWPGSRRRCGPASAGAASTGRSRTRTPCGARGAGAVLGDPFRIIQDKTARLEDGAPSRANRHPTSESARAADPGRRTPAAPAVGGARTDSHHLPGAGPLHRLKEDVRTLIHAPPRTAATAQRTGSATPRRRDAEGYKWPQTLRRWWPARWARGPRAQPFTHGYIEGGHTQIKSQKRQSYGFRHRNRYRRKMLLASVHRSRSHRV